MTGERQAVDQVALANNTDESSGIVRNVRVDRLPAEATIGLACAGLSGSQIVEVNRRVEKALRAKRRQESLLILFGSLAGFSGLVAVVLAVGSPDHLSWSTLMVSLAVGLTQIAMGATTWVRHATMSAKRRRLVGHGGREHADG